MRSLLLSALALSFTGLNAQITLGPADMPSAGDTVRYRSTVAAGVDPVLTEAGFVWDMSALQVGLEGADTCVTVASTPFLYQLFFNNPFQYAGWQANYAVRGQSLNFQALTVTNLYDYFKKDATGFRNVGFGANVNGLPTSVRRTPVDWVYRFPLEYGDMDTSVSSFTLTVPTLFSFTQHQTRYNEVDGWGTLILPGNTFEVLRVKSTLVRTDSMYVDQFGQGFSFPEPETVEYKWLAQGMDEPVLIITAVGGTPTTARFFYDTDLTTGVAQGTAPGGARVVPNPAHGTAWLEWPADAPGMVRIVDATGRVVREGIAVRGAARTALPLDGLEPGAYVAQGQGCTACAARFVVE
jgi:hypothetical protein